MVYLKTKKEDGRFYFYLVESRRNKKSGMSVPKNLFYFNKEMCLLNEGLIKKYSLTKKQIETMNGLLAKNKKKAKACKTLNYLVEWLDKKPSLTKTEMYDQLIQTGFKCSKNYFKQILFRLMKKEKIFSFFFNGNTYYTCDKKLALAYNNKKEAEDTILSDVNKGIAKLLEKKNIDFDYIKKRKNPFENAIKNIERDFKKELNTCKFNIFAYWKPSEYQEALLEFANIKDDDEANVYLSNLRQEIREKVRSNIKK